MSARHLLELTSTDEVVRWAEQLVVDGCESAAIVWLAGHTNASAFEVREALNRALSEHNISEVGRVEAGRLIAVHVSNEILNGSRSPYEGASFIWWRLHDQIPELDEELTPFVGLASEWEDSPEFREAYDDDIRSLAAEYIAKHC